MVKIAQGDAFELGVSVQVKNPKFQHGSWYEDVLDGACNASATVPITNAADEAQVLAIGDRVQLGSNASGVTESKVIQAISSRTVNSPNITLTAATSNNFASGVAITGYGTNLGGAWDVGTTVAVPGGITAARGKIDRYSQKIGLLAPAEEMKQTLDDDDFETSTLYRVGMYYKQSAGDFYFQVYDGNSAFINKICDDTTNTWVAVTDTGTCHSSVSSSYIRLLFKTTSTLYADCVFLEHDSGQVTPAGFYTFTEYPDLGSLTWGTRNQFKGHELLDGVLKKYSLSCLGDNGDKYILKGHFSWVSQTFWKALVKFGEWQARGRLLNLHPHITDLPPVITGYMEIGEKSKDIWDLSKRSFSFVFTEA